MTAIAIYVASLAAFVTFLALAHTRVLVRPAKGARR